MCLGCLECNFNGAHCSTVMANEKREHGSSSAHTVMRGHQLAMRAGPVFHAWRSCQGISPFEHLHLWVEAWRGADEGSEG